MSETDDRVRALTEIVRQQGQQIARIEAVMQADYEERLREEQAQKPKQVVGNAAAFSALVRLPNGAAASISFDGQRYGAVIRQAGQPRVTLVPEVEM